MATTHYVEIEKARVEEVTLENADDYIDVVLPSGQTLGVFGNGNVEIVGNNFPYHEYSVNVVKKLKKATKAAALIRT